MLLFIGDIFGKPGREIVRQAVRPLVEQRDIDFVIANVENSAAGFGVTGTSPRPSSATAWTR
jgi:2',3'-cyclic-nucleotide 2'-phosphodiesterase